MTEVFLLALLLLQSFLWWRERRAWQDERSRLSRMAYAETHAERIAALIPQERSEARAARSQIPRKPLGI